MSLLQNSNAISAGGYDINNSLRFRSSASASLSRTFGTPTSGQKWTMSFWIKRGVLGAGQLFAKGNTSTAPWTLFYFDANGALNLYEYSLTGTAANFNIATNAVFRDPSAWYHIVVAVDTTQATAANRQIVYVNNVQQTFSSASYYPQNTVTTWNSSGGTSYIFQQGAGATTYTDGYLAETYFVDGQQLTPSSFGETDTDTGTWKAKKYTGTYGTNGFYLPFTTSTNSAYAGLFNGSSKSLFVSSNAVFGYGTSDFTMEGWFLFSDLSTRTLLSNLSVGGSVAPHIYYNTSAGITYYTNGADRINGGALSTNKWYHIAVCKSGSSTKLFVNGIQVGSTYTDTNNYGTSNPFIIADYGSPVSGVSQFYGYISNVRVVKGTALYTSNFVPTMTALTNISGTSILTLQNATIVDNSSNSLSITNNGSTATVAGNVIFNAAIASDYSGNKNNWITNNIEYSFYGSTYDSMTDSPTLTSATVANYAVMSPIDWVGASGTLSSANLNWASSTNVCGNRSTIGVTSGKWYWEAVGSSVTSGTIGGRFGFTGSDTTAVEQDKFGMYWHPTSGIARIVNGTNTYVTSSYTYTNSDVLALALDLDNNISYWYKNGVLQYTYDFSSYSTIGARVFHAYVWNASSGTPSWVYNFGQRPFSYTPRTNHVALNTYNLPDSTVKKGNRYMDAVLFTGTGANLTVSGFNFSPDLVWNKSRSVSQEHVVADTVRGANKALFTRANYVEDASTTLITGFTSTGYTLGSDGAVNTNGAAHVGWGWDAGDSTVTNTNGTITSQVRANTTAGLSIVTYTGVGSVRTVGHGLGVAPKFIIAKSRNNADNWPVGTSALGWDRHLLLNLTNAVAVTSSTWSDTAPTSSVFTIGTDTRINGSGWTYVAYCWAEIAGFSRFGSYTGNGSTDGPFVYLGFRPKYILIKRTDSSTSGNWSVLDSSVNTYNEAQKILTPNTFDSESTQNYLDLLSNGFKVRYAAANQQINTNGGTYIYAAFAENPFKNANAR